jgi:pimeloyl-ACP methyl ester carboxylesterase
VKEGIDERDPNRLPGGGDGSGAPQGRLRATRVRPAFATGERTPMMRLCRALLLGLGCLMASSSPAADGPPLESQRLYEVRGARLHVEQYGQGAPLLFLHGGLHHFGNSFGAQRDYFAGFRRVVGVDQRGHGHSPDTDAPFSYREMAEDTAALIEALGIAPVDVVGHSDGGDVALLLARYHPGLVRRLVVSGANLRSGLTPAETEQRRQLSPQQFSDRMPAEFRADYVKASPDGAAHWLAVVAKSQALWLTPVVIEPEELRKIANPVLVVAGDRDFTSIEETAEIYRSLPRGQLLILPDTGHGTFGQRAEFLNPLIRTFHEAPEPAPHAGR